MFISSLWILKCHTRYAFGSMGKKYIQEMSGVVSGAVCLINSRDLLFVCFAHISLDILAEPSPLLAPNMVIQFALTKGTNNTVTRQKHESICGFPLITAPEVLATITT